MEDPYHSLSLWHNFENKKKIISSLVFKPMDKLDNPSPPPDIS